MMNIPTTPNESISAIFNLEESIPIKYQDPLTGLWKIRPTNFGGNADVIEDTEPHRLITLCMMSGRSDHSNGILDLP